MSEQLQRTINPKNHDEKVINLQFNIDGLPLFKTGGIELCPLLAKIDFSSNLYQPLVIAVYCGKVKPKLLNRFFAKFIEELNTLLENGVDIEDVHFVVKVKCFICDRPARSFVKNMENHNGYYACDRCA